MAHITKPEFDTFKIDEITSVDIPHSFANLCNDIAMKDIFNSGKVPLIQYAHRLFKDSLGDILGLNDARDIISYYYSLVPVNNISVGTEPATSLVPKFKLVQMNKYTTLQAVDENGVKMYCGDILHITDAGIELAIDINKEIGLPTDKHGKVKVVKANC
jgi:hypothetical protein